MTFVDRVTEWVNSEMFFASLKDAVDGTEFTTKSKDKVNLMLSIAEYVAPKIQREAAENVGKKTTVVNIHFEDFGDGDSDQNQQDD